MKGIITGVLLTLLFSNVNAQASFTLSHQVMTPAAGLITAGGISFQQSAGEAAVDIFVLNPHTLTQGFQQPRFVPDNTLPPVEGNGVAFFPNPLREEHFYILRVRIYGDTGRSYSIMIVNFAGSVVFTDKVELNGVHDYVLPVDMSFMSNGFYVARVMSADGFIDRSFKISKL